MELPFGQNSKDKDIVISARNYLSNNWGVDEIAEVEVNDVDTGYEALVEKVEWMINYLIDKDIDRLFWMLYRIDVSEQKVRATLDYTGPDNAARSLAELVIEREVQKAITRANFKDKSFNSQIEDDEERW